MDIKEIGESNNPLNDDITIIKATPMDWVAVVRCKDCIYSSYYGKICHYSVGRDVEPEHYCARGKRREE